MFLGSNLRHLRTKHGYTQREIAEKTATGSDTTVSKWESGDADPPIGKVAILSKLYKVCIDDIVNKDLRSLK